MSILRKRFPDKADQVRILWKSPLIPSDPLVWRKDLPEEVKIRITKAFLRRLRTTGTDAERERKILAAMSSGWAPFRESTDAQLLPIRQLSLYKDKVKNRKQTQTSMTEGKTEQGLPR